MGYGGCKVKRDPCGKFTLNTTTTKYKRNSKYEFVGIAPIVRLEPGRDWIEAVVFELSKGK